jgi:hypothetical protein
LTFQMKWSIMEWFLCKDIVVDKIIMNYFLNFIKNSLIFLNF